MTLFNSVFGNLCTFLLISFNSTFYLRLMILGHKELLGEFHSYLYESVIQTSLFKCELKRPIDFDLLKNLSTWPGKACPDCSSHSSAGSIPPSLWQKPLLTMWGFSWLTLLTASATGEIFATTLASKGERVRKPLMMLLRFQGNTLQRSCSSWKRADMTLISLKQASRGKFWRQKHRALPC